MSWSLILTALAIVPTVLVFGVVSWMKWRLDQDDRRDPLTTELCFLPAAGVVEKKEQLREEIIEGFVTVLVGGYAVALLVAVRRLPANPVPWSWFDTVVVLVPLGYAALIGCRYAKAMPRLRNMRFGARAEQAVAQEIGTVLAGQNRLIHDVRAKDFNIDHVVITPAGVFAVETKSRRKPPAGGGVGAVKVRYDGRKLEFPGWVETEPIAQAERQARWLAQHLKAATGEAVAVTPVLALPGWFVENTARISDGMVRVVNPKGAAWLFLPNRSPVLDVAGIQRVAFAVEKLALAGES